MIECYNKECKHHSCNNGMDEGPFCYEEKCVLEDQRPVGLLTVIGAEQRAAGTLHMVFADVICKDEEGNLWGFRTSQFNFDMKPYKPE